MILITGAAGKTGRAITQALKAKGQAVRAFVRSPEQAEQIRRLGAVEVHTGDLLDESAVAHACRGVEAIYHICPNMHPREIEIGEIAIAAAQRTGVERFVFHSVLRPHIETMPHHWNKLRVEEMLFASGLPFTILQPCAYMQNIMAGWEQIRAQGIYTVPYRIEARLGLVDLEDVAQAAAAVLTDLSHTTASYELAGPENLSQVEVAAALSEVLGRTVTAQQVPIEDWRANAQKAGLVEYALDTLLKMFSYYDQHDFQGNSTVLKSLLGREPTNFKNFLDRMS